MTLDQLQNLDASWKKLEANFEKYYTDLQRVQATHQRYFLTFHEKLKSAANSLKEELSENGPFTLKFDYDSAMVLIAFFKKCLLGLKKKEFQMNKDAVFFHIFLEPLETLKLVEQELEHLKISWIYVKQHDGYTEEWSNLPIVKFDVPSKKVLSDNLQKNIKQLKNEVQGTHWVLLDELLSKVDNLNEYYEVILNFQESTLQKRHWDKLRNLLNLVAVEDSEHFFKSADFTFSCLQSLEVENLVKQVSVVATQARKEYEIEKSIEEVENIWMSVWFDMKDFKTFYKLEGSESIVSIIESHQMNLRAMKASKYVGYFANKVDSLENSLSLILDVIEQVESFQSKFFLLENIFGEQTIQAQLPKEATEFENVTFLWKDISVMMKEEKLAWNISHKPGFFEVLYDMNGKAEEVEKCLEAYLESKRRTFPRLYFLSNDDLLSIIGQDSPLEVQRHLKKLFDNLDKLEIAQKMKKKRACIHEQEMITAAVGMYSKCHEYVKFIEPIHLDGPVESWLLDVERMMHLTLSTLLPNCLHILLAVLQKEDINFAHLKWLNNWPGQICSLSLLIAWTAEVTGSIKTVQETAVTTALKNLRKKWLIYGFNAVILQFLHYLLQPVGVGLIKARLL
ncbi:Dynein heavy chain 2, axonemal, partial [Stegodyphus mimosarum]